MVAPVAQPLVPDYSGRCVNNLVPSLLGPGGTAALPDWFPEPVHNARQVVLLVLDGLGWNHMQRDASLAPSLHTMDATAIATVVPSTTATALTSIATGLAPGEHGIVGYRFAARGEVLNVLRWSTAAGDARKRLEPRQLQPIPAFLGTSVPVVTKAEFAGSGFSMAHLGGGRHVGYRVTSSMIVHVRALLAAGERFIYAYYDGIDKVAHEHGYGPFLDAELVTADRLVSDMLACLPSGAALVITADHGQIDVGSAIVPLDGALKPLVAGQSGEGRFRWLHAHGGTAGELLAAATEIYSDRAWVVSIDEVVDCHWLGPTMTAPARGRLGDVALVARDAVSFDDPADSGPFSLVCRHGSLTEDEMLVPLLAAAG